MFKTILAHLTGTHCDASVLAASFEAARPFGGHIECLYVAPDAGDLVRQAAQIDVASSTLLAEALASVERQRKERSEHAQAALAEFRKRDHVALADAPPGPDAVSASWREIVEDETGCLAAQGRFHDLLVLAGGPERSGRLATGDLGEVIVSCGRPVLLAPEKARAKAFKTVAVAWKNTPEAARAMTAAMPLLEKARKIEVLSANEEGDGSLECVDCTDNLVRQLQWHGLSARGRMVIPAGRSIPNAILETAREAEADLLVMGAYGRSRLREFIFGGFTRRVLEGVELPVMLFH